MSQKLNLFEFPNLERQVQQAGGINTTPAMAANLGSDTSNYLFSPYVPAFPTTQARTQEDRATLGPEALRVPESSFTTQSPFGLQTASAGVPAPEMPQMPTTITSRYGTVSTNRTDVRPELGGFQTIERQPQATLTRPSDPQRSAFGVVSMPLASSRAGDRFIEQRPTLPQMRERGASVGRSYSQTMRSFGESRIPNPPPMTAPQGRFGQPLTRLFPNAGGPQPAQGMGSMTSGLQEQYRSPFNIYGYAPAFPI
jgi:hypothetical protein